MQQDTLDIYDRGGEAELSRGPSGPPPEAARADDEDSH
jgi:hypothetical protein